MGKVKFLGRGKILKLTDSYFNVRCKYSVIKHTYIELRSVLLVKIVVKLFYNMENLYTALFAVKITI